MSPVRKPSVPLPDLLYPSEAARLLRVHPKTLTRWAACGALRAVVTPSGHRRYPLSEVQRILASGLVSVQGGRAE